MTATTAGVLTNIFTAPQAAFAAIKERPNPWLPLLAMMGGTFVVQFLYMQLVDLPWLSSPAGPYAMLPPTPLVPLGVIGASGVLDVPYAVGDLPPAASVRTLYVQVLARGVSTTALTGASALVIVDAGP